MLDTLSILPVSFWVVVLLLTCGALWAAGKLREGIGLPVLAVLGTVAAWYVGDVIYNDYPHNHGQKFTRAILDNAWWQVAGFLTTFLLLTPLMLRLINGWDQRRSSHVMVLAQTGVGNPRLQSQLHQLLWGAAPIWVVLAVTAYIRLGDQTLYYFCPYLGEVANPWERGRVGAGFDSLLSLAAYLQIFLATMFGLVAALARNGPLRALALIGCFLVWPYYIFNRARSSLLAVMVPAIMAWVLIRLRGGWLKKLAVLTVCFALITGWLAFVISYRSSGTVATAIHSQDVNLVKTAENAHHEGLNMFEELCWINTFMADGSYQPNWGQRYFAEIVNPIPRSLWANKPMIGIDYAAARGQGGGDDNEAGVYATISTGMIGQGVVNFGLVLGPAFAAWLMALWAAFLARLDLRGDEIGNIPLYALGMILTFNLGRDITFITLYTFFFGMAVVWWVRRRQQPMNAKPRAESRRRAGRKLREVAPAGGGRATEPRSVVSTDVTKYR